MKVHTLYRNYFKTHTAGSIALPDQLIYTVERPWIPAENARGGVPFESCIPEGIYEIARFVRSNGDRVWSLSNPDLGVYVRAEDRAYQDDRYACLFHVANKAHEVVGCIAPGMGAHYRTSGYSVSNSGDAMRALDPIFSSITHLEITSYETLAKKAHF